jgi:acyl-coenzyme A synthetase/AMP-(fatty) acid ligase
MSAVATVRVAAGDPLPLMFAADPRRIVAFDGSRRIAAGDFLAEVAEVARELPAHRHALNLCEDRYAFLVAFCAVALRGQANLLPHSRAQEVVTEMLARYPDSYCLGEQRLYPQPPRFHHLAGHALRTTAAPGSATGSAPGVPTLAADALVAIGFTSGSTGQPSANPKRWHSFSASTARNAALLHALAGGRADAVATVPPQHMYGMELSVLLPLLADVAVHTGRPFFPAEIAMALEQAQAPRLLVTTPVHLRALLESGMALPPLAAVVTATAPLPAELAQQAEARFGAPVQELFGSTETCVIAHRRTATEADWTPYAGIRLAPQPDGTEVDAPWYDAPVLLQDVIELLPGPRFALRGRCSDLIEIAGKRASLGELTQRLLAVPGVVDAVVFQAGDPGAGGVRRIAALAVAPGLEAAAVLAALRRSVDPVFLPRPLKLVDALPRNATGKLVRHDVLALLGGSRGTGDAGSSAAGPGA